MFKHAIITGASGYSQETKITQTDCYLLSLRMEVAGKVNGYRKMVGGVIYIQQVDVRGKTITIQVWDSMSFVVISTLIKSSTTNFSLRDEYNFEDSFKMEGLRDKYIS